MQDLEFDNGIVHVIDELLTIPLELATTLLAGGFTALAGAATELDLVQPITELSDITIFAPNNDAFRAIAGSSTSLTADQLTEILQYHVVQGTVGYSTTLSNTSLTTLQGGDVEITITGDGAVFVNNARVINADVLIANGVLHVIDAVLDPNNPDASPDVSIDQPTATASFVPFTSGLEPLTGFSELSGTTSFVAAGLVTEAPSMSVTSAPAGNMSVTSTYAPVVQTVNAGVKHELPALAVAVGALAFAAHM